MTWTIYETVKDKSSIAGGLYLAEDINGDLAIVERFCDSWQPYLQHKEEFEVFKFTKIERQ